MQVLLLLWLRKTVEHESSYSMVGRVNVEMWNSSSVVGTFIPVEELSKPCSQDAQAEWRGSWRKPKKLHRKCDPYVMCKGITVLGHFSGSLATFLRQYA